MNSKKKNKNRQHKPPNPTPPQKQEVSEPSGPPEVTNAEIESVVEERVPNIINENVAAEVKETEETPKKPKRNRGKKKKEDDKSDNDHETRIEEVIPDTGLQPMKESSNEANVAPTVRKKKNKNKKSQGPGEYIEETEIVKSAEVDESSHQSQEVAEMKIEEPEQETKSTKKKNKKKKNRNDSERSDKAEEVSCTSAFQKLLADDVKAMTSLQPSTDDSSVSEATVKEVEVTPQPENIAGQEQKDENNKNKKKNKKDKIQPTLPDVPKTAEQPQSFEIEAAENISIPSNVIDAASEPVLKEKGEFQNECMPSTSTVDEKNSKHKAKIAKPVEKKKKGKGNEKRNCDENLEKESLGSKIENVEELVTVTNTEFKQEPSATGGEVQITEDLDDVILVPITEITPDWQEEVNIEEGNGPVIGCDDKNDTVALHQPIGNFENPRNRKKSPKPSRKSEMPMSSDILTQISQSEEPMSEASSTSNEQTELKPSINVEEHPQIKFEEKTELPKDVMEVANDTTVTKNRDKRQESPKPSKDTESAAVIPIETSVEIHKSGDIMPEFEFNKEQAFKSKVNLQDKVISLEDKYEDIQVAGNNKRKNRKKSPKPPKKNEIDSVISSVIEKSEMKRTDETILPAATSCPEISTLKIERISEINEPIADDKTEQQKDDIERMKTPDSEKCQKRKKSPKPILDIDVASSSRDTQESKQNILKIEDIIIIQAEVVSDEKAQKCDTFIASEDGTDKQDPVQKIETAHGSGKSKKRKKSPKPPQRDSNLEKTSALETQVEIQIPMTPETQDTKLPPENIAVELETLKMEPMPSPSDVTPDFIEYPRCSSEHLDNNNNMIIQEISRSDAKLEVPFIIPETPLIQRANINSPELDHVIKAIEPEPVNKSIEEKTDLKSKVMEVNQEMEELRLSIERSLAELTSLEKTDIEEKVKVDKIEMKPELPIAAKQSEIVTVGNVEDTTQPIAEMKPCQEPICPARKDHKGKGKAKKKGKQEAATQNPLTQSSSHATTDSERSTQTQDTKKDTNNKSEQKSSDTQEQEKQKAGETKGNKDEDLIVKNNNEKTGQPEFAPIENFEDAMTSSVDDVNKTFEMIVNDINPRLSGTLNNPEINVIAPQEDKKDSKQDKQNPISPPKNLLGHPDIPVQSSRPDYKKEKNKLPNNRQAKVKIKDMNQVQIDTPEKSKQSKESQTESKREHLSYKRPDESICVTNQNDDYVYKYSFRKVFLQCACHVCKKDLKQTKVPCSYCNLIFYCNQKHKDEDYTQHQALCFAVSTIVHLKDQKFIYADARDVTGHNYRLLRMQMIVSCEKVLKRRLAPWEQEALLYPRMCGYSSCRKWRQGKLVDCEGCGQISYCSDNPDHLPKGHARWCKSYNLYRALVKHQQTQGRLEPRLPTKVVDLSPLPDNINEVLASMYEEKIDMSDIEYAALTQLATAPLTALFCLQHRPNTANGITKKSTLTLHIVGAELQFEADVLNKWEVFLLHLVPHVKELKVVLVGPDLNPSNLPLELLGKIKLCENCRQSKRRVVFGFQDKRTYHEFWASEDFTAPDLVCAFNPSIQRSSTYNGKDTWPSTINCVLKLKTPLAITSYTLSELTSDLLRLQECAGVGYNVVFAPKNNSFSSVRPDRNFISDDEAPLLFKNHCVTVVCGV